MSMKFDTATYLEQDFGSFAELINAHALNQPERMALREGDEQLTWSETAALVNRIAAQLQADGLEQGQAVSILGTTTVQYALAYLGAIVAGGCAAPLTTSATPAQLAAMMADSGASHLFIDSAKRAELAASNVALPPLRHILMDQAADDAPLMAHWMAAEGSRAGQAHCWPGRSLQYHLFQRHYRHAERNSPQPPDALVPDGGGRGRRLWQARAGLTALHSPVLQHHTGLCFWPPWPMGEPPRSCANSTASAGWNWRSRWQATHTMLVPVQYQRLMDYPHFDDYDLSSLRYKNCTSAPFPAELKAQVLERMPGALIEIYSMTEGGVVCLLLAHLHPDKLHTVGVAWDGSEVITIDEELNRLPTGEMGELVGRSRTMMSGYHNQPGKTEEASWYDENGDRWQRMGDIGCVDEDGFITLMGRSKDMIISGGFNIYPRDLEEVLLRQPGVVDAAVIGVPSRQWGETPLGFVVTSQGCPG